MVYPIFLSSALLNLNLILAQMKDYTPGPITVKVTQAYMNQAHKIEIVLCIVSRAYILRKRIGPMRLVLFTHCFNICPIVYKYTFVYMSNLISCICIGQISL